MLWFIKAILQRMLSDRHNHEQRIQHKCTISCGFHGLCSSRFCFQHQIFVHMRRLNYQEQYMASHNVIYKNNQFHCSNKDRQKSGEHSIMILLEKNSRSFVQPMLGFTKYTRCCKRSGTPTSARYTVKLRSFCGMLSRDTNVELFEK